MAFSWVPFYRELAERVLEFEDKQDELLAILREIDNQKDLRCVPLLDNQPDGTQKPLEVIDPFTFMANLARVKTVSALLLCSWFKQKWNLEKAVPTDFEGRAGIQARGGSAWFFGSVRSGRQPEDVGRLWTLARQAFDGNINDVDFELLQTCMNQNNVGFRKLTSGLSWIHPEAFLPLGGPMIEFLQSKGVSLDRSAIDRRDAKQYLKALQGAEKLQTDFVSLVAQSRQDQVEDTEDEDDESEDIMPLIMPKTPLNQILYGPPGTGKTFNVVRRAVQIIEPNFNGDFKTRFEELRAAGQIGFVTFHQSFSYEEFIEGLRPVITDKVGEVRYEIRDGILKTMARWAEQELDLRSLEPEDFNRRWNQLLVNVRERKLRSIGWFSKRYHIFSEDDSIRGFDFGGKAVCECTREQGKFVWESTPALSGLNNSDVRQAWPTCPNAGFIASIINEIKNYRLGDLLAFDAPRFVLIIDEINRGNISKILGELITLLEDDKRLGADNELRLTLPVSGETFALPPNLFILGTMNTADKSLAQLDVALRRRFSFIEMAPDFGVCDGMPDDIKKVLELLNERIEWAIDREHRLGHASWMGVKNAGDFGRVWREKAMPLLVELFADNLEGLRELLGDGDNEDGFVRPFKAPNGMKGRARLRLYLDCENAASFDALATLVKNLEVA